MGRSFEVKVQTIDKKTLINSMKVGNPNVTFNKVKSNEEHPKVHIGTQFNNKATFMDLVIVEGPLIATNETLSPPKNVSPIL